MLKEPSGVLAPGSSLGLCQAMDLVHGELQQGHSIWVHVLEGHCCTVVHRD